MSSSTYGFLKESPVDGPQEKRIEEYAPGESLYSVPAGKSPSSQPVLDTVVRSLYCYANEIAVVETELGFVKGGLAQLLYADGRQRPLHELRSGMLLLTRKGGEPRITSVRFIRVSAPVYFLFLKNRGDFFVKGFLAGYPAL